jgi:hypothetical protein
MSEYPSFFKIAKAVQDNDLVSLFAAMGDIIMETVVVHTANA